MRRAAAALAALFFCAGSAAAAEPPRGAPERAELLRRMDRVLADPADEAAKAELGAAAGRAAAAEKAAAEDERAELMAGAEKDHARLSAMQGEKAARTAEWKRDFSRACSLAGSAATVRQAVDEYERLLEDFPVYSDAAPLLAESGGRIRGIFYETVKKTYPYLTVGRTTADAKMLASLQFARTSAQQSETGGGVLTRVAERELRRADKLRRLEEQLEKRLDDMSAGLALFRRRRWAEAVKLFDAVLSFDKTNEEALYYKGLARARAAAESVKR